MLPTSNSTVSSSWNSYSTGTGLQITGCSTYLPGAFVLSVELLLTIDFTPLISCQELFKLTLFRHCSCISKRIDRLIFQVQLRLPNKKGRLDRLQDSWHRITRCVLVCLFALPPVLICLLCLFADNIMIKLVPVEGHCELRIVSRAL